MMRRLMLWLPAFLLLLIASAGGKALALTNFQAATVVIGQTDFTSNSCSGPAANTLCEAEGAPARGKKILYVADPSESRVLGFKNVPKVNGASAKFVLGQTNFSNQNRGVGQAMLSFPVGVAVAGKKLFVLDFDNSRVLIWNKLPTKTDKPASVVVGQPDFTSKAGATTQSGLDLAEGLTVAGGKLFVSDRNNNRIMIWNKIPTTNGANADLVVGQADFTSSNFATTQTGLASPEGVWSDGKKLVVADSGNHRVLIWNTVPTSNGKAADVVVGQADFTSNAQPPPVAQSLRDPFGVTSDGASLFVADSGNNRVLVYTPFPTANHPAASIVLGQADFTSGAADGGDVMPSAKTFSLPFGLSIIGKQLFVSDDSNSRVLIFNL